MANTLILYDGKLSSTERVANSLGMIIGNVCIAEISEAPEDISPYDGFCFIFNFYGALTAGKTRQYLTAHREAMVGRRIALVGMGFSDNGFTKYVVDMEDAVGEGISITGMFISDENQVFESGFQIARMFRAPWNEMDPDELTSIIDDYIKAHTTLALATAGKGNVRCTPLEYIYHDGVFYIVTEGGLKFRSLLSNDDISAAIFEPYDGSMDHISGLQFSGKAVIVERGSDEYWEVLGQKHVTREACENLPVELFIVRIIPLRYEFLSSKFNEDGYDAKQFVNTRFAKQRWEDGVAFAKETVDHEAVARREMAEKAAAAEKAIEENKRSISFTEIQAVRKPYDSSDIEALLKEAEEPSDEARAELTESAEIEQKAGTDYYPDNDESADAAELSDSDEISDDQDDDFEDDLDDDFEDDLDDDFDDDLDDDFDDELDDDFGDDLDDDLDDDFEDDFDDDLEDDEFEDDYDPDDEADGFEDEYEEEPVREITKASGEIDIEELRRLMEEDENNESSGDYTFADDDESDDEYEDDEYAEDEYEDDEYEDDEYEDDEYDDELEDGGKRTGREKKGGFSLKNFLAGAFGRRKTVKEDEYEEDEYEEDEYEDDEYEDDDYELDDSDEYEEDEYEDDEFEDEEVDEYEDEEYEEDESYEYEDEEYEEDESDEYGDEEYEENESDEYEDEEYEEDALDEYKDEDAEHAVDAHVSSEEAAEETEAPAAEEAAEETEAPAAEEAAEKTEVPAAEEAAEETEVSAAEEAAEEAEAPVAEEAAEEAETPAAEEVAEETEAPVADEVAAEEVSTETDEASDEDEDQPEAVLAYNVQDAIEKIRRNMAGVKAEQTETYAVPELAKTDVDMTEVVQAEDLTLDEDEIAEKYGNGPDIEGDFDMLDEDNTYDLFETENDAEETSEESDVEKPKADWEDAEKRVSSFRQIFSYRNEMENEGAKEEQNGGSPDSFSDEDEEFEKLFGFRNTSIYADDETDFDRGRSYGRTRFDDDDDFEYDDEYSYDEDDDVLTDDELDELADDEEDTPERGKKKGGFFSKNPFAGLAGLFSGKKKSEKEEYEDDEDAEYDEYEDDEDAEYDEYEDDEDAEYDEYEDDEDAEYDEYEDDEDAEYDEYEDDEDAEYDDYEDELPDFEDTVKSPAVNDNKAAGTEKEDRALEEVPTAEYVVDEVDFTELGSNGEDEDDGLEDVKEPPRDESLEGAEYEEEDDLTLDDEYEEEDDLAFDDEYEDEDDLALNDEYEDEDDLALDDEYEDEDDFALDDEDDLALDDEYEDEDDSVGNVKKRAAREPKRGGFFSGLGRSLSSLIGSSRREDDDDEDLDDFDDDDEEEMRGDVIDRLERNFENSVGRSEKYVVPTFDDSYDDPEIPEETEEEEDDLLPYEDYDIPEISYTDAETESVPYTSAEVSDEAGFEDDTYEDAGYEDDEDDEYDEYEDDFEDDDFEDEGDIYDELEEDDSLSSPGIRKRSKGNESSGKSGGFISRLKAAFGGMKKQSRIEDDEYEDDEYEDDEYEDDEYEDDEYEDDEYEDDEYEYEDDEYEDDEYEDDDFEDEEDEPVPAKKSFGSIFMRKKPEKKVRGWNSEPVGKWNDEEEGVFDLDRDIDSVDITNLSDRLVAALDDDMVEEIHPDLDK